jgi:hypothetical protein
MAGTVPWIKDGPETYEVNVTTDGGLLVVPDTGGKIKPCVLATATNWLGVSLYRGEPSSTTGEDTTYGYPRVGYDVPRPEIAVGTKGIFKLLVSEAVNFGDVVYPSTTAGAVQKTTATGRAVGIVVETAGIANGARGKVRLFQ